MTVRKHEVANDGISRVIETRIELRPGRGKHKDKRYVGNVAEAAAALNEMFPTTWGFEGAIGGAEKYWRGIPVDPNAPPLSKAWYAARILREIARVRKIVALRSQPTINPANLEAWILSAMDLGEMIEEAVWRFGVGDQVRLARRFRAKQRERAIAGVKAKRKDQSRKDDALNVSVRECRLKHPDYSLRAIASALLSRHGRSGDRRKAIDALAKRIARLNRRK